MTLYSELGIGCSQSGGCSDQSGCPEGIKPDFCIKRNSTAPSFKINVEDCDGVVDLTGNFGLQASIWATAKLKRSIDSNDLEIAFADNLAFDLVKQNNIILMSRARNPEKMRITGFDEDAKTITVQRGYDSTQAQSWSKGSSLRVFRVLDGQADIESVIEDVTQEDGTVLKDQLVQTFLVYNWTEDSTSLSGCFWLEFKLTELDDNLSEVISVRRYPSEGEGFLIRIIDSPT
jgi:hypothetical protein